MNRIRRRLCLTTMMAALFLTKGCGLPASDHRQHEAYNPAHATRLETADEIERDSILMGWPLAPFFKGELLKMVDKNDHIFLMEAQKSVTTSTRHKDEHHWSNLQTGHKGSITYIGDWRDSNGYYCRRYLARINTVKTAKLVGEACFMPNGTWKTKN